MRGGEVPNLYNIKTHNTSAINLTDIYTIIPREKSTSVLGQYWPTRANWCQLGPAEANYSKPHRIGPTEVWFKKAHARALNFSNCYCESLD